jgi:transcription elongation factor SPT4
MQGDREIVHECTSANFDGLIAMMKPNESWASRWQGICALPAGRASPPRARPEPVLSTHALAPARCFGVCRSLACLPPASRAATFVPGCYALRVRGTLPNQHLATIEDAGIRYKSLDDENS